eukprot:TRINITY_DN403_c0_g1_i2.p1 TRINITY_DN403_c0_g1~~TRINITY_DN403_c0_g1_i2.p1  ORF type:complete len:130 (+),score=9.59 TRINITY_DN403_c0_g1_i2:249-638(+)
MRRDVQEIFKLTPHQKQVMMFSATLSSEIRPVCKKFMTDVNTLAEAPSIPPLPLCSKVASISGYRRSSAVIYGAHRMLVLCELTFGVHERKWGPASFLQCVFQFVSPTGSGTVGSHGALIFALSAVFIP